MHHALIYEGALVACVYILAVATFTCPITIPHYTTYKPSLAIVHYGDDVTLMLF